MLQTLIEAHAASLDLYADLSGEGASIQGVTDFFPGLRPRVRIDAGLASESNREVRLRTTLAHEFAHVHLHDSLFQMERKQIDLFASPMSQQTESTGGHAEQASAFARCKRETIVGAPPTDWMEWQAGYVCGALLMPRRLLKEIVHRQLRASKHLEALEIGSALGRQLTEQVASTFFVSTEAARVRLKVLGLAVDKRVERSLFE
ncbi:MAG: ImmA/IrrE family metallo-endopeptidase [Gemmatimonadaceae bacterium]